MADVLQHWTEPGDRDGRYNIWSTCKIDGLWFPGCADLDDPGVCEAIPRCDRALLTDKHQSLGRNNARQLHHGYAQSNIEITVRLHTPEQWAAWLKFFPSIDPARKVKKTTTTKKVVLAAGPPAPAESVVSLMSAASVGDVVPITTTTSDTPTATVKETKTTQEIPSHTLGHPFTDPLGIKGIYITWISTPEIDDQIATIKIKAVEIIKSDKKPVSKGISISEKLGNDDDVNPAFKLDARPRK